MKRTVVVISVLAMTMLIAGNVSADQPFTWTGGGSGTAYVGSCGDFDVYEDVSWELVGKAFFDTDGNWIRSKVRWKVEGRVFNVDAPENFLPYKNSSYNVFNTPEDQRITGLWALVTVPGEGAIFMDVGLIRLDWDGNILFEAGKHQWWNANVDGLCDHLR